MSWNEILAVVITAGLWAGLLGFFLAPHLSWRLRRRRRRKGEIVVPLGKTRLP